MRIRLQDPEPRGFQWPKVDIRVLVLISLFWIVMAVGDNAKMFEARAMKEECEAIMFRDVPMLRSRIDALQKLMALRNQELVAEHERMRGLPFLVADDLLYGNIGTGGANDEQTADNAESQ